MTRTLRAAGAAAILLFCVSCGTVEQGTTASAASTPEESFYAVIKALRAGDVETARKHTLYSDYVDWPTVIAEARANPNKYRVRHIIFKDATPQLFASSNIYYKAADGNNYVVEFTRVDDRWYWGSAISTGMARLLENKGNQ